MTTGLHHRLNWSGRPNVRSAWSGGHLWCLLVLQLVGMFVLSTLQYDRFNLTSDFAAYSQAWTAIGHGHLDPTTRFWGFSVLAR